MSLIVCVFFWKVVDDDDDDDDDDNLDADDSVEDGHDD